MGRVFDAAAKNTSRGQSAKGGPAVRDGFLWFFLWPSKKEYLKVKT
jgi:hypothetical protein